MNDLPPSTEASAPVNCSPRDQKIRDLVRDIRVQVWRTNHVKWQADSARKAVDEAAEEIIILLENY